MASWRASDDTHVHFRSGYGEVGQPVTMTIQYAGNGKWLPTGPYGVEYTDEEPDEPRVWSNGHVRVQKALATYPKIMSLLPEVLQARMKTIYPDEPYGYVYASIRPVRKSFGVKFVATKVCCVANRQDVRTSLTAVANADIAVQRVMEQRLAMQPRLCHEMSILLDAGALDAGAYGRTSRLFVRYRAIVVPAYKDAFTNVELLYLERRKCPGTITRELAKDMKLAKDKFGVPIVVVGHETWPAERNRK